MLLTEKAPVRDRDLALALSQHVGHGSIGRDDAPILVQGQDRLIESIQVLAQLETVPLPSEVIGARVAQLVRDGIAVERLLFADVRAAERTGDLHRAVPVTVVPRSAVGASRWRGASEGRAAAPKRGRRRNAAYSPEQRNDCDRD
jgi:hypothetical protein